MITFCALLPNFLPMPAPAGAGVRGGSFATHPPLVASKAVTRVAIGKPPSKAVASTTSAIIPTTSSPASTTATAVSIPHGAALNPPSPGGAFPTLPMVLQQQQESIEKGEPLERQNGPQWRYTRDSGWQNITKWNRAPSVRSNLGIQFVHPGLIGAQILLLTAIAMLWASDEWQIARVMGREPDVDEPEIGAEHSAQESAE